MHRHTQDIDVNIGVGTMGAGGLYTAPALNINFYILVNMFAFIIYCT